VHRKLLIICLLITGNLTVVAAEKDSIFNKVFLGVGYLHPSSAGINPEWKSNPQFQFISGIRYWNGYLLADVKHTNYQSASSFPDFSLTTISAGYEYRAPTKAAFTFHIAAMIGNAYMQFEDNNVNKHVQGESELCMSITPQVSWHKGSFGLVVGYYFSRIYTATRFDQHLVQLQTRFYLQTPKKVKSWLE
jgi:hypothetical protein